MNERIRLLAEQCVGSRPYNTFDYEKFALLIVRECAQKLEDDGMVEVAMEMKQHFGVE